MASLASQSATECTWYTLQGVGSPQVIDFRLHPGNLGNAWSTYKQYNVIQADLAAKVGHIAMLGLRATADEIPDTRQLEL